MICDKHGGRNRYGPLLAEHFPEWLIEVRGEGRQRSVYRFGPPERRVEVCFRTKAESCLPAALASMASKYLRELAMQAFNDFWRRRVPGLAADGRLSARRQAVSRRHRRDADEQLHIDDRVLWRVSRSVTASWTSTSFVTRGPPTATIRNGRTTICGR